MTSQSTQREIYKMSEDGQSEIDDVHNSTQDGQRETK